MNLKKIGFYLLCLIPWFISAIIFRSDTSYYNSLNLPFFAPPSFLFGIIWPILYFLVAYSIYRVWNYSNKDYKNILLINYISNQLFSFFFFTIKNNFLSFVDTIVVLVSSIYLYKKTKSMDEMASKYLIPYIVWNIFALLLIFFVFIKN